MKKFLIFFVIFGLICSGALCVPASASFDSIAQSLKLYSENYLLVSLDNSTVIFEKNADKQCAPASLTKIVTAAVVLENCEDLNTVLTVPEYCIQALVGTASSVAGLKVGEQMTVEVMLHCLLIESANDAAMVLADYIGGGSIAAFVELMNAMAQKLGCDNTSFVNPHGLDDDYQFTTPRDIATLTIHALSFPVFEEIVSMRAYTVPETNMTAEHQIINTNHLMNSRYADYYCKYASGVKTGSTSGAGKCVVSTASNNGYKYLGVVMNAPLQNIDGDTIPENCAFVDCKTMFDWAIENFELVKISDVGSIVAEVPVKLSWSTDYITLSPGEDSYELVPVGTKSGSVMIEPVESTVPKSVDAPIKKGDVICKANVIYAGETIAQIELVATSDVSRSFILYVFSLVARLFSHTVTKIVAALVGAIILCYVIFALRARAARRRRGKLHVVSYRDFNRR